MRFLVPVFDDPDRLVVLPICFVIEFGCFPVDSFGLRPAFFVSLLADPVGQDEIDGITLEYVLAGRISVQAERVLNRFDDDILIESVVTDVLGIDPPSAEAAFNLVFRRLVDDRIAIR